MAMWNNQNTKHGQMVMCLLNFDKFLSFVMFSFWCSFLFFMCNKSIQWCCKSLALQGISLLSLSCSITRCFFHNFKIVSPKPTSPQHYWWLIPEPPAWASIVISKEGTSLHALFTKSSKFFLTYWIAFLVSSTLSMISSVVSKGVGPFKNSTFDSFTNVSSLASSVKICSLTCNASSYNLLILFNNYCCLDHSFLALMTRAVFSCIAALRAYGDT